MNALNHCTLGHLHERQNRSAVVRSRPAHTKTLMTNLRRARSLYLYRYTAGIRHPPTTPAHGLSSPVCIVTSSFYHSKQVPAECYCTRSSRYRFFLTFPPLPPVRRTTCTATAASAATTTTTTGTPTVVGIIMLNNVPQRKYYCTRSGPTRRYLQLHTNRRDGRYDCNSIVHILLDRHHEKVPQRHTTRKRR